MLLGRRGKIAFHVVAGGTISICRAKAPFLFNVKQRVLRRLHKYIMISAQIQPNFQFLLRPPGVSAWYLPRNSAQGGRSRDSRAELSQPSPFGQRREKENLLEPVFIAGNGGWARDFPVRQGKKRRNPLWIPSIFDADRSGKAPSRPRFQL